MRIAHADLYNQEIIGVRDVIITRFLVYKLPPRLNARVQDYFLLMALRPNAGNY